MVRDLDQVTEYLGVWRSKDEIREALAMPFADDIPRPIREAKKSSWWDRLALAGRQQRGSAQAA